MKEIVNFFAGRRYSAVNTNEMQTMGANQMAHKSLQTKPSLNRGISVLDALFHERKAGKRTRWPKSKLFSGVMWIAWLKIILIYMQKMKCHLNSWNELVAWTLIALQIRKH